MGMTKSVTFAKAPPAWPAVRDRLTALGHPPQMRLIDNMPAFPDEDPPENWRDIRLTFGAGMLTIRNDGSVWHIVVWGNADEATLAHQEMLAKACSE
ncbi:hypothetical protein [Zavarzinella formosa]|uniref:hypothetical protein n=1 Tax=Zavarzinella formosa TaxID=360055 RepID=UPI0002D3AEAC|nr:hypothetical protein [Zavarzinella formosa]